MVSGRLLFITLILHIERDTKWRIGCARQVEARLKKASAPGKVSGESLDDAITINNTLSSFAFALSPLNTLRSSQAVYIYPHSSTP